MARHFLLYCSLFHVLAAQAQNYVTLFEDCNYKGKSYYLEAGNYRLFQMKMENDKLSSFLVPAGMKLTLYEHDNFSGRSKTFTGNIFCLDENWNDQASSVVVESNYQPGYSNNDYVVFYNDCYSKGYSRSLLPGTYTGSQLGILKNNISSFKIEGNLQVRIYTTNDNASGYSATFDSDQPCLSGTYNDKIKSLVIERRSGGWNGGNNSGNNGGWTGGNNYATIYTECSYRGNSLRLSPGYYQGDKLGLLRYDISSIELPSNLRAKVYINNEYLSGSYYTISDNTSCLSTTLNNRIGSLIIEEKNNNTGGGYYPPDGNKRVTIYTDENYRGQSVSLYPGTYSTMAEIGFPDDALTSLSVPDGYRVVIYEHPNFGGKSYTITSSKSKFYISGWNDKTSSIAVYRDR